MSLSPDTIILKVPAGTKPRWVRQSQAQGKKLSDWVLAAVERPANQAVAVRAGNMTTADLRAWQASMGYTYNTAAAALGVSRATYARWLAGPGDVPRTTALACSALAAGMKPWHECETLNGR